MNKIWALVGIILIVVTALLLVWLFNVPMSTDTYIVLFYGLAVAMVITIIYVIIYFGKKTESKTLAGKAIDFAEDWLWNYRGIRITRQDMILDKNFFGEPPEAVFLLQFKNEADMQPIIAFVSTDPFDMAHFEDNPGEGVKNNVNAMWLLFSPTIPRKPSRFSSNLDIPGVYKPVSPGGVNVNIGKEKDPFQQE